MATSVRIIRDNGVTQQSVDLTPTEVDMLQAAMCLVTPVGGGGPEYNLGVRLARIAGRGVAVGFVYRFYNTILTDRMGAGAPWEELELTFAVNVLADCSAACETPGITPNEVFDALVCVARAYRKTCVS